MNLRHPSDVFFECIRCGSCCRDTGRRRRKIVLTSADLRSIAETTHLSTNEFCRASHTAPEPFRHIMRERYGACTFLDKDSRCNIYNTRPMICRCYPFSIQFDDNNIIFLVSSKDCPGLGRGSKLLKGFFENLAQEVVNNFKTSEENTQD
jgi:Fe-S-cluster containining protein